MAATAEAPAPNPDPKILLSGSTDQPQRRRDGLGTLTVRASSSAGNSLSSNSIAVTGGGSVREGAAREMPPDPSRHVRTLPTWVQRREEDDEDDDGSILIAPALPPQVHRRLPHGSVYDPQRERTPVTPSLPIQNASRWKYFLDGSATYPSNSSQSDKEGEDWLAGQPDLNTPWLSSNLRGPTQNVDGAVLEEQVELVGKTKGRTWYMKIHIMLLNSPMVPLTFRSIIWVLSLLALSFAASIFQLSREHGVSQKPSTIMAIVVDAIALVYLIYITYDEYSGKPLGLRSPSMKIRLLMCDLVFIVFDSANLSLAFDTLFDVRWSCRSSDSSAEFQFNSSAANTIEPICSRQEALAAFLFLALCAWVSTFMVSVFRVVERVSSSR